MSSSVKSYSVRTEDGGVRELSSEEVVSKLLTKSLKHTSVTTTSTHKDYASNMNNRSGSLNANAAAAPGGATPVAVSVSTNGRRTAPTPELQRSGGAVVDAYAADATQRSSGSSGIAHILVKRRDPSTTTEERRDPPAGWLSGGGGDVSKSKTHKIIVETPPPFIQNDEDRQDACAYNRADADEISAGSAQKSPRARSHPPNFRHPHHALPITSSPAPPSSGSPPQPSPPPLFSNNSMTSRPVDRLPSVLHPPMSPANGSFTVNTEREGKKVMSQAEMSEFIRNSIVKARQQAATSHAQGKPPSKTALVEFLPPSVRTNFRAALKQQQQPIVGGGGRAQGPFPWSPILAQAASTGHNNHFDELEMRSIAEWTEPSQLTEPSTLIAMSEHFRHSGGHGHPGISGGFIVVDRNELYEEVATPDPNACSTSSASSAKKVKDESSVVAAKSADNNSSSKDPEPSSKRGKDPSIEAHPTGRPITGIECPPAMGADNSSERGDQSCLKEESGGGDSKSIRKSMGPPTVDDGEVALSPPMIDASVVAKQSCCASNDLVREDAPSVAKKNSQETKDTSSVLKSPKSVDQEKDKASIASKKSEEGEEDDDEDRLDTIESLRHMVSSPKSTGGASSKRTYEEGDSSTFDALSPKSEVKSDGGTDEDDTYKQDDDDTLPTRDLPPTIDIMSDREIDKIVHISMDKAQKTAKKEVQELLQDSKRRKNKLVVKTAEGSKIMSQREVADLIKETMQRARESAQLEIASLVRDSLALARESAKEEIREIVEESMRRARESTQREMQEFVKESMQKARWSDASAVSYGSSQGFGSAADLTFSLQSRQQSFGSHNVPPKTPGHASSTFLHEHLKALSEEDHNAHEAPDPSVESGPRLKVVDKDNNVVTNKSSTVTDKTHTTVHESKNNKSSTVTDKTHTTVHESIEPPALEVVQESSTTKSHTDDEQLQAKPDQVVKIDSNAVEYMLLDPDDDSQAPLKEEDADSSMMVIKTVTSPDVFEGIEDPELQDQRSHMTDDKILRSRKKDPLLQEPINEIQVFSHEEEEGIEIDPLPATPTIEYVDESSASSNVAEKDVDQDTEHSAIPNDPTGSKDSMKLRDAATSGEDHSSISKEAAEKLIEAGESISDSLREFDEKKQKRIEDAALALLAESERASRKKERRRARSVARYEAYTNTSGDDNTSGKEKKKKSSSRAKRHSKKKELEQLAPMSPSQFAEKHGKSDKGSRQSSTSSKQSNAGPSKSHHKSHSKHHNKSYGSKSSKSRSCAAETVVTQEFLAQISPKTCSTIKESKDTRTPKVQNLTRQANEKEPGKARSHTRTMSKDSVTVPENKFCLDFFQFLISGDDSVAESAAARAAFVGNGGSGSGNESKNSRLSALTPAAMFTKGTTWIDSLAEDMSSVVEGGNDSTEFDTEGDGTTFEQESSYSRTDGEGEDEEDYEEFTYSHDDNSYNAGWWSGRGREQYQLRRRWNEKRRDDDDSVQDDF